MGHGGRETPEAPVSGLVPEELIEERTLYALTNLPDRPG
jgi:hypothetical protein